MKKNVNTSGASKKRCAECRKPLPSRRGAGRKQRYCSDTCRSAARRGRNFVTSGHTGRGAARNGKSNARFTRVSRDGIGGRTITDTAKLARQRWDAIVERETGLPKPPPGMLATLNLRKPDLHVVIIAAPNV
jgi:hypothetical protein